MGGTFSHNGEAIQYYRKLKGMTRSELAMRWPSQRRQGCGVAISYVQGVESGKYPITNIETLRALQTLLAIPPGDLGLSTSDAFHMDQPFFEPSQPFAKFLDLAEYLIGRSEETYSQSSLPKAARDILYLHELFEWLSTSYPAPLQEEQRFLTLWSQVKNLDGVIHLGFGRYDEAYQTFQGMLEITESLHDPTMKAHALLTVGTELGRQEKKQEAVVCLESARDLTFSTSKAVAAYVHAYLARAYAEANEPSRAQRAIKTALDLAPATYGNGEHFIYHTISGLLAEQSHILLTIGQPAQVLAMYQAMEQQTMRDGNWRVKAWLPYDAARAYRLQGQIEASASAAHEFFSRACLLQAPHPLKQALQFIEDLHQHYHDVAGVREVWESTQQQLHEQKKM